jgi:tetratricopeptide (TPR) repeat protein
MTAHYQGRDFMMIGSYAAAIEKFLFVTEHMENKALKFDAWDNLCEAYFQMGNYAAALAAVDSRMAIDPDHPGPWYQKFAVYNAMGNSTAALEAAEVAMSKRVGENDIGILLNHDPAWYQYIAPFNVAQAYLSANNIERAYKLYKEVKNIAPQYVEELSNATGIQWDKVFEQAYRDRDITI